MSVYKTVMTLVGWIITSLSESEMVSSILKPPWRGFSVLISVWDRSQMRTFLEPANELILYLGLSLRPLPWILRLRPLLEPGPRRTSLGRWDEWDDTVLQTQDAKFEPWRSEAEHATSRSRRLPTILSFTRGWGRNIFVSFKPPWLGTEPRTLAWKAAVLTTTLGPPPSMWPTEAELWHLNRK